MDAPRPHPLQVHVSVVSLISAGADDPGLWHELAADERARADRFATPQLRRRYVTARGTLRRLLSGYLSIDARKIVFGYGARGKPHLVGTESLAFNLSHADDVAIYAIASGREVGVDIEAMARDTDIGGVARVAFSAPECTALDTAEPSERREVFYRIWTRKEAYIKARGEGFGYPTRSFSVSHRADGDALIADELDIDAPQRWRVIALDTPPGFTAALAVTGRDWSVLRVDAPTI